VLQRNPDTGFSFTGRVYDRGEWLPLEKLINVGESIELFTSQATEPDPTPDDIVNTAHARLISLLGLPSAVRLRNATIGIIGCSGTGSPAAHVLARAGVGNFVLVDPQRFEDSNLERQHGSRWEHVELKSKPYKVELVTDLISSINPTANITAFAGNILHDNVHDELLRCDLLVGCTDTQHARAKLSDLSHHYLIPAIDLGVLMEGEDGKVTSQVCDLMVYSPDMPCAFCSERIDGLELSYELMSDEERARRQLEAEDAIQRGDDPDQYWRRRPRQLHTVGYLTTMLGALGAGYAEGMLTGTFHPPHPWFQFDAGQARLGVAVSPRLSVEGCVCGQHLGWADAAAAYRTVARPAHWPKRGMLLSRSAFPS
jgi:hypothetical protein